MKAYVHVYNLSKIGELSVNLSKIGELVIKNAKVTKESMGKQIQRTKAKEIDNQGKVMIEMTTCPTPGLGGSEVQEPVFLWRAFCLREFQRIGQPNS